MGKRGLNRFCLLLLLLIGACVSSINRNEVVINCEKIMLLNELDTSAEKVYFILNFENKSNDTIRFRNTNEIGEYSMNYVVNTNFNLVYSMKIENLKTINQREFLLAPNSNLKQLYFISRSFDSTADSIPKVLKQSHVVYRTFNKEEVSEGGHYRLFTDSVQISLKNASIEYINKKIDFEEAMQLIGGKRIN